ncbi:MAG: beta-galactosidase [Clostridiales bacterium]|nr:beta-galactosidase [Clostridiales bacterium]
MYTLDLRAVTPKRIVPLSEKFSGTSPAGDAIAFTNYAMLRRGRAFFGVSGEMHYCRVSPDQWEDAVLKMKAGGINIISTYVFWIVHEEEEGVFRFDGCRDVRRFVEICERHGMLLIMRMGPFCHGEFRNGGLPDWLYGKPYDVRDNNPGFLAATRRFFRAVHQQLDGHYFAQGGCIIAAQIENEYQHSSAPWEITTGVSCEWVNGGHSGEDYMLALKRIMQEEGIVTPFYTTTAWGGAITPVDEALPLWGGYSYQPWIFYNRTGAHPATPEYIYRDNHNNAVPATYNFAPAYPPESRPYACCEMMGGMMCSYNYRFQMDMRAIDALANTKLGSGCNLLGYYMYKGGTNPTGLRTPYLNESQVSKRSYDYQAALGEFGQVRESYGRLKALHLFCQTFAELLAETKTVLPEHLCDLAPDDLGPLRFCVRVKGDAGFLFVNNFQDHIDMTDRRDESVTLRLPGGDVTFRFSLAAGENAVLPFGVTLGSVQLDWATAMPMAHIGDTWFFLAPDGMQPVYGIGGQAYAPQPGEILHVDNLTLVTLSRRDSNHFYLLGGKAYLCDKPLMQCGDALRAETDDGLVTLSTWERGAWQRRILGEKRPVVQAAFHQVGVGRYVVDIPQESLAGHKQVLLRVHYTGDIGHAFVGGRMISDNFANGAPWDIRIDCEATALSRDPLTLYITPIKENVVVDVSSAMAGRMERASGLKAELLSAEIIPVDEITLSQEK